MKAFQMSEPEFRITLQDRTRTGCLKSSHLSEVYNVLEHHPGFGFVILPSDACYSLAAYADSTRTKRRIDKVLKRDGDPISLSCSSYEEAMAWANYNEAVYSLLEAFTPGPITVVCKPGKQLHDNWFDGVIGSSDRTIGLRIPDSIVERDVSAIKGQFLLTSPAIREIDKTPVTNLDRAIEIVQSGLKELGEDARWGVIEGTFDYASVSTVVRVETDRSVKLIREGDIPFSLIKQNARMMPIRLPEDRN